MDRGEVDILHPLTSLEWRKCRKPPVPLFGSSTQSVCLNGKVYVSGRRLLLGNKRASARLYIYTPASDKWDTMDTPVYDFALTVYHSQLVLVGGLEYVCEDDVGRPSNKVWTLGEDGKWQTTLPPLERTCTDASAVSHGDHLFVTDSVKRVFIYNSRYWATAQHPTFTAFTTILQPIKSTIVDGYLYVTHIDGEVRYASLNSLIASSGPSQTPQSSSVWEKLPDTPRGCSTVKFGNRLIAVGERAIYAFSPIIQFWVESRFIFPHHPSSLAVPYAIVLSFNELMVNMGSYNMYKGTLKVTPFDLRSRFTMRSLSMLEAAGIPLMRSLEHYTKKVARILQISLSFGSRPIKSLLHDWLRPLSMATYPPTWNSLLQITRLLNLHDLAERAETCLKATTVDHQRKETVGSGGEMSSQDEIIYQLKQENALLRGDVELLKSENEQLRSQSLPIWREEVKTELKEEAFMMTKAEPTSDKLTATGGEYESQLHSHGEMIYQLKQKVASLQCENERLISRFYPEPIKEEVEEKPLALIPVKTELKKEAVTMTKAEPSSDKAVAMASWDLPGVEVCGEMSVVVHSSRYQPITWEGFGLRLHIQEDSLPAGMEQCTLSIKASLAGQYEFPENSSLVSAVFWLRCEPTCKFTKPVTVEIQHCAKSENVDNLKMRFVRALCSQAQLPYTFKELGGDFNRHSSYGVIQVNGFSGLAVTQEGSEEREYCSQLFYLGHPKSYKIYFVVTWNIEAHLTVVKEEYERKGAVLDLQKLVDFESDAITLDIPKEGITVKGWKVTPKFLPVVTKKQVDNINEGKSTQCCQLLAEMREKITSIKHRITLKGSKQRGDFILINLPQGGSSVMEREQMVGDLAADLGPPTKRSRQESDQSTAGPPISSSSGSAFFSAAEKIAGVPFLYHYLLECDSAGREWTNVAHDITLRIPEGAVAEGEKIHFEVGVAMYGPFIFPDNTQPISPILWLCLLEENVELKKPFQVVLPHYLTGLSKERVQYHQVGFAKASHNDYTIVNNQMTYKFQHSEIEPVLASSGYRSYGVLISKHCCFYCLKANHTPELANDTGYCLTRIESFLTPQRNEVYFSATYFLDTCLRSLEEQFPREHFQVSRHDAFKFKNGTESLQLIVPVEYDQCIVALEPKNGKINPSDVNVDFGAEGFAKMQLKHERRMYPPRIKMTVAFRNPDNINMMKLPITFTGYVGDEKLDMDLILPLGSLRLSPTSTFTGSGSQNTEPSSHTITCEPPKLRDVFRKLLPVASRWKTIGVLLGIPKHVLDKIQSDEEGVEDRLQEMLSEWLKQVDPAPTWKDLADAVDVVDQQKAKEIREQCVDLHIT